MLYYVSVRHADRIVWDEEGSDLPNVNAARQAAIDAARELMADAILRGDDISCRSFEIAAEDGRVVAEVPFAEAIRRQA